MAQRASLEHILKGFAFLPLSTIKMLFFFVELAKQNLTIFCSILTGMGLELKNFTTDTRARMHHKVVGNFGREADVRSLYYRRFRFNETSDNGTCTHGRLAK